MSESLRVGLAGLGTVGASVARALAAKADELTAQCGRPIELTAVCARNRDQDRGVDLSQAQWFDDPVALAKSNQIDVFVELIGGEDGVALDGVTTALEAGRHVVTANKALLAKHGVGLAERAEKAGVILNFEAAVAGGIPIIKTMRESLSGNAVSRVYGIMNGTANYILTRMERDGISFANCLADAQRLGYAEADPTFDIEGHDTAHKLAILTSLAFGTQIAADDIYMEGISNIALGDIEAARELGYRIKLLGVAQRTPEGIEQRVHPTMVPLGSVIAQVEGVTNAVAVEADIVGTLLMSGPGAGGDATASAVIGDLADIAKSQPGRQQAPALGRPADRLQPYKRARMRAHEGGYFVRMTVHDRPGVFADIARHMADQGISLESIVQHGAAPHPVPMGPDNPYGEDEETPSPKTVILTTHETTERAVRDAIAQIVEDGHLISRPQVIRIERAG
ncbi:homoserine dehydrogenase [Roseitalea porphyridii]|uniref:Homoserine dehydrogenase n=1 Tax=Roseitalea porphyridii TaxID=1852022 RepID=A0A4P6V2F4_9HYPH|nr:homoserine dehydrogenase [Roseitalea porphyridii]QBK30859.1 homoserine dehydrogenase [Roseitalea porphyridii]